jgi:hypothetical protein
MPSPVTDAQLRSLRSRDRLTLRGQEWHVKDYSQYQDPTSGYKTEEWQIKSGKERYDLMREVDPAKETPTWYLAEILNSPTILAPGILEDLRPKLAQRMRNNQTDYPTTLQVQSRFYQFESSTTGHHRAGSARSDRITWDYWDSTHHWNLALEAWEDGSLLVYSTREIQPEEVKSIQRVHQVEHSPVEFKNQAVQFLQDQNADREKRGWIVFFIIVIPLLIIGLLAIMINYLLQVLVVTLVIGYWAWDLKDNLKQQFYYAIGVMIVGIILICVGV